MQQSRFRLIPPKVFPFIDWVLIIVTLVLCFAGLIVLWGATAGEEGIGAPSGFVKKQAVWIVLGLTSAGILAFLDYRSLRPVLWWLYGILVVVLIGMLKFAPEINGARSWIMLGPMRLQPSEPGKLLLIIALAHYLARRGDRFRNVHHVFIPGLLIAVPILLIVIQPDLGTGVIFVPVIGAMFWAAGLRWWVFLLFIILGVAGAVAYYPHLKPHQKARIDSFVNPNVDPLGKDYNVIQSQMTLGSGELFGKGWGKGTQTQLNFLPEHHTDFIFPTAGEQFGLIGCMVILTLLVLFIWRLVYQATRTPSRFGMLIITGLTAMFCTHILMNVGMAIGLLPVTGIPLPFFSYGGSFMLTTLASVGLVIGIGARREVDTLPTRQETQKES